MYPKTLESYSNIWHSYFIYFYFLLREVIVKTVMKLNKGQSVKVTFTNIPGEVSIHTGIHIFSETRDFLSHIN